MTIELSAIDPNTLPPQMRRLVALIGMAETVKLLEARGGTTIRVPQHPRRPNALTGIIGQPSIDALSVEYAGQMIELPMMDKIVQQLRNVSIRSQRRYTSAAQLAREYGLTRRQIINIAKLPDDDGQMDLFEEKK